MFLPSCLSPTVHCLLTVFLLISDCPLFLFPTSCLSPTVHYLSTVFFLSPTVRSLSPTVRCLSPTVRSLSQKTLFSFCFGPSVCCFLLAVLSIQSPFLCLWAFVFCLRSFVFSSRSSGRAAAEQQQKSDRGAAEEHQSICAAAANQQQSSAGCESKFRQTAANATNPANPKNALASPIKYFRGIGWPGQARASSVEIVQVFHAHASPAKMQPAHHRCNTCFVLTSLNALPVFTSDRFSEVLKPL